MCFFLGQLRGLGGGWARERVVQYRNGELAPFAAIFLVVEIGLGSADA
jgi:hypothetical protein